MNTRILASVALAAAAFLSITLRAELPAVPAGEKVLFSDDFANNDAKWTSIASVNGSGSPAVKHGAIANSLWAPAIISNKIECTSSVFLKDIADLANGPLSLYMRVRVENPKGADGSRFDITLNESTGNHLVTLSLRPSLPGGIAYRDPAGKGTRTNISSSAKFFRTPGVFVTFKLTLTPGKNKFPATAEAFYYDTAKSAYVSLGKAEDLVNLTSGKFNRIAIVSRNGDPQGATWFDSVVLSQIL